LIRQSINFGFLSDPDTAIRKGRNIALWDKLPSKFDDINEKYLEQG